ncbi:MAG: hypothetical protein BGN88_12995 [Clostridiales bacterium 43-6]|nr:MAG: hypothetical protein BGN88_12995 [Clostridiales bacterium 43-6]
MRQWKTLLVNTLTLSRIPLALCLCYTLYQNSTSPFLIFGFFLLTYITDMTDGFLARTFSCSTRLGGILDVSTDLLFILSLYAVMVQKGWISFFILAVVLLKFTEFLITSSILKSKKSPFVFDLFGKLSAGMFYGFPLIVSITQYGILSSFNSIERGYLLLMLTLTLLSSAQRITKCILLFKHHPTIKT